jgi:hypothetical protein
MGQIGGERSILNASRHYVRIILALALVSPAMLLAKKEKETEAVAKRDPRQLSVLVADFDGTVGKNVGNYRLRRIFNPEHVAPFFQSMSGLPAEIEVPVADFEGNVGPRIGMRIGKLDDNGHFVPSTSLDPIKLSNGTTVIPGLYYLDPQSSYVEMRTPENGGKSHLVSNIQQKIRKKEPFLLDAYAFLSATMVNKYKDRVKGAILTMRGHKSEEMQKAFTTIQKANHQGVNDWPLPAFVNLTNPDNFEFSFSKAKYLRHLYDELADRVIQDTTTPHYLFMFENDREHLKRIDEMFISLANRGVFSNPVVPVLVNLVEPEVFANPDGISWDELPMKQVTKMSRVTVYWPGRVERTDDMSRVFELSLGLSPTASKKLLAQYSKSNLMCKDAILGADGVGK